MDPSTDPAAFLDDISVQIYSEPFASYWEDRRELPEVLRNVVLVIDFDTELNMEGLSGLLENRPGEFLPEMILALEVIGARETADALRSVQVVMAKHGITHAVLRGNFDDLEEFEITTWRQTHGEAATAMLDEVVATVGPRLRDPVEDWLSLLWEYVPLHQSELLEAIVEVLEEMRQG
jgi:hypothetical protein